jgi:frataxin-like iron-binding protein CyaY
MECNQLLKLKGLKVEKASISNNVLTLEFNKKVLFINTKKVINLHANENISSIAIKAIDASKLADVEVLNNNIIKLEFDNGSKYNYTVSFKVKSID